MNTHAQKLTSFDRTDAGMTATTFGRGRSTIAAFFRTLWLIIHTTANIRNEMQRMADEIESTRPEQAARLRKLATSNWGE